ncbi:glycosyltransferase family 39 protein [Candidatus Uabimicrobium amorphum]|uniref:Uncharacterized protein n=1 Tax=Uabimicrobium amorphum TaxID=2596890 RepID=A0A5S9F685_UABAM|nr:glycosyltransferase family 39 protein [Candidatus Uabimicrobium amorphum]BBM87422.1 hypothetical protein UABAM_05831 [Candidatus Uabimicrobium amorphum]
MVDHNFAAKFEHFIAKRNLYRQFLALLLFIAFILLLLNSVNTIYRLYSNFFILSNSIGEDGKVFFAKKFQQGQLPFANGEHPPYYPSFHGVLTHVSVGMIGRFFKCSTQDLYYVGRFISVLGLLLSLLLVFKILSELDVKPLFMFAAVVLLMAPGAMHALATSYRPDYWINAIYLLIYYLVCHKKSAKYEVLTIVLIVVAYLIKPTGIIFLGAFLLVLLFRQHWRKVLGYSLLFVVVLGATVFAMQHYSGGMFLSSFAHGMNVPFSLRNALKFFVKHTLLYLTLLPVFAVFSLRSEKMLYLLVFWSVSLAGAVLTSMRSGVGLNYYLSTFYFTVIIIAYWFKDIDFRNLSQEAFPFIGFFLLWLIITMILPTYGIFKHTPHSAVATTLKFGKERQKIAQWINSEGFICFSDDAGLNLLLSKPQILYPILLNQFIKSRSLSKEHFLEPIKKQKYDFVVLTSWRTQHIDDIPDYFFAELEKYYVRTNLEFKTSYIVLKRKP